MNFNFQLLLQFALLPIQALLLIKDIHLLDKNALKELEMLSWNLFVFVGSQVILQPGLNFLPLVYLCERNNIVGLLLTF